MNRTLVLTNGIFDVIHAGHIAYLKACKELGGILVVGINDDLSTRSLRGEGKPIYSVEERAEILNSIRYVDRVVVFSDVTAVSLIHKIKPDVYVKGQDYEAGNIPEFDAAREIGAEVVTVEVGEDFRDVRTSAIINRILADREEIDRIIRPIEFPKEGY